MALKKGEGLFKHFEPAAFPDLTGLSSSARKGRAGHGVASSQLSTGLLAIREAYADKQLEAVFLTAWSKVLATLLGEQDICSGLAASKLVPRNGDTSWHESPTPVRAAFVPGATYSDMVAKLDDQIKHTDDQSRDTQDFSSVLDLYDTCVYVSLESPSDQSCSKPSIPDRLATLLVIETNEQKELTVSLYFRRSLLLDDAAQQVVGTFDHALTSICRTQALASSWDPSFSRAQLSIQNPNAMPLEPRYGPLIQDSVRNHANHEPASPALDFLNSDGTRTLWTYQQLMESGTKIARHLISQVGVQIEDSIPICVPKSPEFYACILGVMLAGAAFTPFSGSPDDRKRFMLSELASKVVLYVDGEDIAWCGTVRTVNISNLLAAEAQFNHDQASLPTVSPRNLVYQMYTSGSTGRPKAVSLEHGNVMQTVAASRDLVPWKQNSRMLQYAAPSFDMCYYDTFLAWHLGICLCSASNDAVYNDLSGVINKMEVSMLGLTPSVAATLEPQSLPSVQWLYCIGEAMPQSLVDGWEGRLINSYGPTEAAQMVTLFPVERSIKSAVIGTPFLNTSFLVLGDTNEMLPVLGVGELCIGGSQVARGYFANEEKTRQSFIDFGGKKLYRTGDHVRMLANGTFEFIGRKDDQVKIRGQRVELGEINKAVRDSSRHVTDASSQIIKIGASSKTQLVLFVVTDTSANAAETDDLRKRIIAYLGDTLPSYMVPKLIFFIDRIPLSAAGKVDKNALTRFAQEQEVSEHNTKPTNDEKISVTESMIRSYFAEAANVAAEDIHLDATIFSLGLDSISAIQIASKLRKAGLEVDASSVLAHPTVHKLAELVNQRKSGELSERQAAASFDYADFEARHKSAVMNPGSISASYILAVRPASALQAGMIAQSIHSDGKEYYNHMTYSFPSEVLTSRVAEAWRRVVDKFEILRSGFVGVQDSKHQFAMVTYKTSYSFDCIDVLDDQDYQETNWRSNMVRNSLQRLDRPPWKVALRGQCMHLSAHHALYDAQALDVILRDLELAYRGEALGHATSFQDQLSLSLVANSGQTNSDAFWTTIGKAMFVTRFPILTPLKIESHDFGIVTRQCSTSVQELEAGCRKHGITMQVAGQAAWGRLVSAYTGEQEITFGTVLSGRVTDDSSDVAFPCITTVPTPVHAGKSKVELLKNLMSFNAEMQSHQFASLSKIQKLTGHANEALFDTLFTYQKRTSNTSHSSMFKFVHNDLTIDYPLSIEVAPIGLDRFEVKLYHRLDKVPVEQAQLIIEQFEALLCDITNDSESWSEPNVNAASKKLYSITDPQFPSLHHEAKLLHDFVAITARETPRKPALEFVYDISDAGDIQKRIWTFEDLVRESNKVANLLRDNGVSQGSVVAICFDKCPEAAFTMLGISKLGCSFLALDSGAPIERKRFIMKDSKAAALVTKAAVAAGLEESLEVPLLNLDKIDLENVSSETPQLERPVDPQELSYCLYTSGTTGTPKGCAITHENVVQAFLSFHKLYRWNDESRWLQFASYHFDVSVMEHFWSWSVGMTVVVTSRDLVFADLAGTLKQLNITHTDLTPSLARLLNADEVPSLAGGVFVTGGEMLRQEVIDKFGPHGAIHNAYGPTEATIGCTMYPGVPRDGRPSNIGWHFPVAGSFIVDPQNPSQPVLRGAVGEFVVSGKLVAQGYIGRPDLTKEKFITLNGQRCYRTGDLVRILHNDTFDFVGRADDQVKLRGQRLEIGEINSVIKARDSSVSDVSTHVFKHPKQQKEQLVAFVVVSGPKSDRGGQPKIITQEAPHEVLNDLKNACQEKLPPYMVPTHMVPVDKLPLSANNKTDAKQLKALYEATSLQALRNLSHGDGLSQSSTDATEEQKIIIEVLSTMFELEPNQTLGDASFFELGLDSISVIGFARTLRLKGLPTISTALIMENSTAARLASAVRSHSKSSSAKDQGSIEAAKQKISACQHRYKATVSTALSVSQDVIESLAPCTPLQQGIITRAVRSGNDMYYGAFNFNLKPAVDVERLQRSFENVYQKVQVLRSKFVPTEDGYIQVVLRDQKLPWIECDAEEDQLEDHLRQCFDSWRYGNDDTISHPLQILLSRTRSCNVLTLQIFHACYDGNSLPLLVRAVLQEYNAEENIEYGPSYHEALPYGPLRETPEAKSFWTAHLSPLATAPAASSLRLADQPSKQALSVSLAARSVVGFETCRRKLNVTPQALLQACWTAILQEAVSAPVTQGLVVSGRSTDFEGVDKVVGPLFNTIPFLLQLKQEDAWRDVVRRCHDFNSKTLPLQHTPLRDIQKWTASFRDAADQSVFDALFVFQKRSEEPDSSALWTYRSDRFDADYPLALEVEQTSGDTFNFTLVTQSGVSDEMTSMTLLERLQSLLQRIVTGPSAAVSDSVFIHELLSTASPTESAKRFGSHDSTEHDKQEVCIEYEWTAQRSRVREQIAELAGSDPDSVAPHTSILELGLDSVDAVKLSSRLRRAANMNVPVSKIMKLLTVGNIASLATSVVAENGHVPTRNTYERLKASLQQHGESHGFHASSLETILPSTPLQEGMAVEMLRSELTSYFNHDVVKLRPDTDTDRLKEAWQQVIDASPILRTRFVEIDASDIDCSIAQIVGRSHGNFWSNRDYQCSGGFENVMEDIRKETLQNLDSLPPLRLTLLQNPSSPEERFLILSLSHALYDGWSLSLLHADVKSAYHQSLSPRPSYEPALQKMVDSVDEKASAYWRQALQDTTRSTFSKRAEAGGEVVETHRSEIPCMDSLQAIRSFCKAHGTTLSAFTQTIWSLVLASKLKQLDVAFSTVLSGRDDMDANEVLYPTMNTVIARSVIHGSHVDMIRYTQSNLSSVSEYQHFPLRKALAMARGPNADELVNSLFIFQRRLDNVNDKSDLYDSVAESADEGIPVAVEAEATGTSLVWRVAAKDSHFSPEETEALLKDLVSVTSKVIKEPKADAVSFDNGKVSVCGLHAFHGNKNASSAAEGSTMQVYSDEGSIISETEAKVRDIVSSVARVEKTEVGRQSSLLSLGLDSISAIKVAAQLRKAGITITVNELLQAETVERIARCADQPGAEKASSEAWKDSEHRGLDDLKSTVQQLKAQAFERADIKEEDVVEVLPASAGQVLMLSKWQNQGLYLPTLNFSANGVASVQAFCDAWIQLVAKTPVLRTIFVTTSDEQMPVLQLALRSSSHPANIVPVEQSLADAVATFEQKQDDQPNGITPAALFAQEDGNNGLNLRLLLSHALYDGYSIKLIFENLQSLLRGHGQVERPPSSTYQQFIARAIASKEDRKDFWTTYLSGLQPASLPVAEKASTKQLHIVRPNVISDVAALNSIVRNNGLTLQAVFLAVYARVYSALAGATEGADVIIGAYVANRNFEGADELEGPTLGFVPLRVKTPIKSSLVELAGQIQRDLRDIAQETRGSVSLQELRQWLGPAFTVDTWVNLILEDDDNPAVAQTGELTVTFGEDRLARDEERDINFSTSQPQSGLFLQDNKVRELYQSSIDIDGTISAKSIDIGVLAPTSLADRGKIGQIIEGIRKGLESLLAMV